MVFDEQVSAKLAEEWLIGRAPGSLGCVLTCRLLQLLRLYPVQLLFTSVLLLGRWGLQAIKAIRRTQAVIIMVAQARSTPICQLVARARSTPICQMVARARSTPICQMVLRAQVARARSTPICQMVLRAQGQVTQLAFRLTAHLTVKIGPSSLHLGKF